MESPAWSIVPLSIIGFVASFSLIWGFVGLLLSWMGGWAALAREYRRRPPLDPPRQTWSMETGYMRLGTRYRHVLTFGVDSRGLYLSVMFMFRLGHPPLFFPWKDVVAEPKLALFTSGVVLGFARTPNIRLFISKKLASKLADAAGEAWPGGKAIR